MVGWLVDWKGLGMVEMMVEKSVASMADQMVVEKAGW